MDQTATLISASAELPPANRPVRIDGATGSAATAAKTVDAVASRPDFFEALVSTVVEIGHLSVFP